jgi:uncharacterized protein (TIGR02285 family)
MKRHFLAALLGLSGAAMAAGAEPVIVAWREKPPYSYTENGVAKGFLLDQARQIFDAAGIPARFVNEPQKRIWANFNQRMSNYCSFGWYRLPEREAIAQYTMPTHMDLPHAVLLQRSALPQASAHTTLKSLLADRDLTLGLVDGVSYGPELDALIAASGNRLMRRTVDTATMIRMVAAGRASYIFVDREDWNHMRNKDMQLQSLVMLDFSDMPPGLKRHIVCSRDMPAETMERLNRAIAARSAR